MSTLPPRLSRSWAGLEAVAEFERQHGRFSPEEVAEAEKWARQALGRSSRNGPRRTPSA